MANTVANVTAVEPGASGAIWRAPIGTTVPTNAKTALAEAFECLGYIAEEGPRNSLSRSTEEERAWGGDVVNVFETEHSDKWSMKLIEAMNVNVLKTVFGDENVSGTLASGISISVNAKEHEDAVYVLETILKGDVLKRVVIPVGRVTEVAEISYATTESQGYDITITCQADTNGNTHYEYLSK